MSTISKNDKIYVAGHRGLVGSAIVRNLKAKGYENVIGRTHRELDLTDQAGVRSFFEAERPDVVVLAAAKVGGINANNTAPAEFAYENMQIQCNVIKCCHDFKVKKLLFLGSTCIYPRMAHQPRMRCSQALWRRPTRPTPLPRSRAWRCVNSIKGSTGMILSAVCPPTCTGHMTTMTCREAMSCPP